MQLNTVPTQTPVCLETFIYEQMAVEMHQREAVGRGQVSCSWPYNALNCQENKCNWNTRSHLKMWLAKQSSALGCWDNDKWNVGWSPIYFIFKVFANTGTALVVLDCHTSSTKQSPSPCYESHMISIALLSTFPNNDPIRRLPKWVGKDSDWLSCRYCRESIWKIWHGRS